MNKYIKLREEALKNAVQQDYFAKYKYTQLGNIDFVIAKHNLDKGQSSLFEDFENDNLKSILWAEAKQGTNHDIFESFVQLILTIGKEKTFEKYLPPKYIAAFDAQKFAFIEYHKVQHIFYQNDFNWNATPSNHETKEFKQLYELCKNLLLENSILFYYETQEKEFKDFINLNFKTDKELTEKISVTKNNFTFVFQRWQEKVKPTIAVDWEEAKKENIISADFFLADLLSENNESIKDNLAVVLRQKEYYYNKERKSIGGFRFDTVGFNDKQKAYKEFWNVYFRPPKEEYWDYIIGRRDLLVPQDIRERKGSFFTPQIWVEKSQEYLAKVLGEKWQDEYYIWDCCAGTGNLLNGLTNYRNVWASTLDKADVDVMKDRISNGWKMFENHVFQFDFLNDEFLAQNPEALVEPVETTKNENKTTKNGKVSLSGLTRQSISQEDSRVKHENDSELRKGKIPDDLYEILADEEKRKKLVIYINPPYAEATTATNVSRTGENKAGVSNGTMVYKKYSSLGLGFSIRELFAQFLIRIYNEISNSYIAVFSKLKYINSDAFIEFRKMFKAKLENGFIIPSNTFDNVKGKFPIGFFIWNTSIASYAKHRDCYSELVSESVKKEMLNRVSDNDVDVRSFDKLNPYIVADVFDVNGNYVFQKKIYANKANNNIHKWRATFPQNGQKIGFIVSQIAPDFQHNKQLAILSKPQEAKCLDITDSNLIFFSIYFAVRHSIEATWLNDRDQFLFPNDGWKSDFEFQADCLIYTLFSGQNRISCTQGTNHWIPFSEEQVLSKKAFKSHFMNDFLSGKIQITKQEEDLFSQKEVLSSKIEFSPAAKSVYDSALELWKYYHSQRNANPDASFYDIRKYFQGEKNGRMNSTSEDETYNKLLSGLKTKMKLLAKQIEPKVYEYGFLK